MPNFIAVTPILATGLFLSQPAQPGASPYEVHQKAQLIEESTLNQNSLLAEAPWWWPFPTIIIPGTERPVPQQPCPRTGCVQTNRQTIAGVHFYHSFTEEPLIGCRKAPSNSFTRISE